MKAIANPLRSALLGALSVACVALTIGMDARAQEVTAATLVDRLQIQDLITRYYNNFGRENAENFADFYAEDAELILGEREIHGSLQGKGAEIIRAPAPPCAKPPPHARCRRRPRRDG